MGVVYMLCYENLCYIGSTVQTLKERIYKHHTNYKCWFNKKSKSYCSSFEIIKNQDYEVIEIEEVIGETKENCRFREQWWIEFYGKEGLVNQMSASGLDIENHKKLIKKWWFDNPSYCKEYYDNHKEELREKSKEYRQQHKEEIIKKSKIYYKEKKIEILEKSKQYHQEKKEQISKKKKEYYQKKKLLLNSINLNTTTTI